MEQDSTKQNKDWINANTNLLSCSLVTITRAANSPAAPLTTNYVREYNCSPLESVIDFSGEVMGSSTIRKGWGLQLGILLNALVVENYIVGSLYIQLKLRAI